MHLNYRNVNDAFQGLVSAMADDNNLLTVDCPSRVGDVRMFKEPVTVTYCRPLERVLLNRVRDANPFFHLYESLWMLAGRRDVRPLVHYNSKIGDIASDDGKTFHGAYGFRWREWFHYDQLESIVEHLKENKYSRRVVLSMWDANAMSENDLYGRHDLHVGMAGGKDVPCNTHAYFAIDPVDERLEMTVCNRSNDMIWGMLGANVVHFSFLQEYLAAMIGVKPGGYNQFTNNLHVYKDNWKPRKWLSSPTYDDLYGSPNFETTPLVTLGRESAFMVECTDFVERHSGKSPALSKRRYKTEFLENVAQPMCVSYQYYKQKDFENAIKTLNNVCADDWRLAGKEWVAKRQRKRRKRNAKTSTNKS